MDIVIRALRHRPITASPVKEGQDRDGQDKDSQDRDCEDPNQRYDPAQEAAESSYHAGEAAARAAAEAASSGFTGPSKHDPVKTGGMRVYESDNGKVSVSVAASSDGNDHGVGAGVRLEW